jgi:hypothetical protein
LGQTLEALEGVIYEYPVFGTSFYFFGCSRDFQIYVREIVKIRGVVDALHLYLNSCRSLSDVIPVLAIEKGVLPKLFEASQGPYSFLRFAAKPLDHVSAFVRNGYFGREDESLAPIHHFPVRLLRGLRTERGVPDEHLVHDHA